MADSLTPALIGLAATALSVTISTFVTLGLNGANKKREERQWLKDQVTQYVTLSLQYPKLDDDHFSRTWNSSDRSDDGLRYESFCCFAFNLLERAWLHTKGDRDALRDILFYEEIIIRHKRWWQMDRLNAFGYEAGFKQFVNDIIKTKGVS